MALDDSAKALMTFGISRRAAKAASRLVRGQVTTLMCSLLPQVENSPALTAFVRAQAGLTPVLPKLTGELVPRMVGMESRPNWANVATVPMLWLEAITGELIPRSLANLALAGPVASRRPTPLGELVDARRDDGRRAMEQLAEHAGEESARRIKTQLGDLLRDLGDGSVAHDSAVAQEWTGWALLAVMRSLQIHATVLPDPSRAGQDAMGRVLAFTAYRTGQALITAAAVDLIDMAERAL